MKKELGSRIIFPSSSSASVSNQFRSSIPSELKDNTRSTYAVRSFASQLSGSTLIMYVPSSAAHPYSSLLIASRSDEIEDSTPPKPLTIL